MLRCKILKNKKAAIGETLTRLVATIIIIFILVTFIYVSSLLSKVKTVSKGDLNVETEQIPDMLAQKTNFAFQLNNKDKTEVENILNGNT